MSSKVLPNCGIINWLFPQQTIYAVKKKPNMDNRNYDRKVYIVELLQADE